MTNNHDVIIEAHEDRIQELERSFNSLAVQILPTLARLEETVENGFERMSESIQKGDKRFDRLETALEEIEDCAEENTSALAVLKDAHQTRSEHKKIFVKWVLGVISAIIIAVLVSRIGLK